MNDRHSSGTVRIPKILPTRPAGSSAEVPDAFAYTLIGLGAGGVLGLLGLATTRWEAAHPSLHFTLDRWRP